MGEWIENVNYPVCNIFYPKVLNGQACFTVNLDDTRSEGVAEVPELMFLMDYNPGHMVSAID